MEWQRFEIISAASATFAGLSLIVAFVALWRTYSIQKPLVWIVLEPTNIKDHWIARIHLRNRWDIDLRASRVMVPIDVVPITKRQNFLMLEYKEGEEVNLSGTPYLALPFSKVSVRPGETGVFPFVLERSSISSATSVQLTFTYEVMKAKPTYSNKRLIARIPGGDLTFKINRV